MFVFPFDPYDAGSFSGLRRLPTEALLKEIRSSLPVKAVLPVAESAVASASPAVDLQNTKVVVAEAPASVPSAMAEKKATPSRKKGKSKAVEEPKSKPVEVKVFDEVKAADDALGTLEETKAKALEETNAKVAEETKAKAEEARTKSIEEALKAAEEAVKAKESKTKAVDDAKAKVVDDAKKGKDAKIKLDDAGMLKALTEALRDEKPMPITKLGLWLKQNMPLSKKERDRLIELGQRRGLWREQGKKGDPAWAIVLVKKQEEKKQAVASPTKNDKKAEEEKVCDVPVAVAKEETETARPTKVEEPKEIVVVPEESVAVAVSVPDEDASSVVVARAAEEQHVESPAAAEQPAKVEDLSLSRGAQEEAEHFAQAAAPVDELVYSQQFSIGMPVQVVVSADGKWEPG